MVSTSASSTVNLTWVGKVAPPIPTTPAADTRSINVSLANDSKDSACLLPLVTSFSSFFITIVGTLLPELSG